MGKAERIRRMNARERIIAQQTAARRAEARKRMFLASGSVLGVLAIVIVLIVVKGLNQQSSASTGGVSAAQSQANTVTKQLATVPAATLNSVGAGTSSKLIATSGQPALTSGGKAQVVYMGAEYCPYCAAERWAMVVALSRFGTFSNLSYTHSSSTDVYPSTPTLTFYKSSYTSKYLVFNPVEMYSDTPAGSGYTTLMTPTAQENALMAKYDAAPYVPTSDAGSFPFVDIGNKYLVVGAQFVPGNLAKLSWAQVATDVQNPSSPVAKDVDGAANAITAAICKITKTAPAGVCTSAGVTAAAGSL
jgi:thiol-disulfide isomerase/thioredoxin